LVPRFSSGFSGRGLYLQTVVGETSNVRAVLRTESVPARRAIRRRKLRPLPPESDPSTDDLYDRVLFSCESHIVCHSDGDGFYVPVDFPDPLYDDLPESDPHCVRGGILGSSQGAMRELVRVAPLLGIGLEQGQLDDGEARRIDREKQQASSFWVERRVWLRFFELARFSIAHRTAVVFQ
jgi:hypothetical protein